MRLGLIAMSDNDEHRPPMDGDKPKCSFCDKRQDQVEVLIARLGGVAICNECVDFRNEIIADARGGRTAGAVGDDRGRRGRVHLRRAVSRAGASGHLREPAVG